MPFIVDIFQDAVPEYANKDLRDSVAGVSLQRNLSERDHYHDSAADCDKAKKWVEAVH